MCLITYNELSSAFRYAIAHLKAENSTTGTTKYNSPRAQVSIWIDASWFFKAPSAEYTVSADYRSCRQGRLDQKPPNTPDCCPDILHFIQASRKYIDTSRPKFWPNCNIIC